MVNVSLKSSESLRSVAGENPSVTKSDLEPSRAASAATLYIRRVAGVSPDRHLLVIVERMAERPQIAAAWPIPVSVAGPALTPMAALHALCVATGHPLPLTPRRHGRHAAPGLGAAGHLQRHRVLSHEPERLTEAPGPPPNRGSAGGLL